MERTVLRANGDNETTEVGDDYPAWNKVIDARIGELMISPDGSIELWADEEGLFGEPRLNCVASMLVGRQVVGDVIVFYPGDVK